MKSKSLIVQKYGGSSVATPEKIKAIANHLKLLHEKNISLVVVLSAMGKTTNNLISLANEFSLNPNKRDLDFLVSTGEMQTVSLMSIYLQELGIESVCLTGMQAGIITNENHSHAFIKSINNKKIKSYLNENKIILVAGFQGVTQNGEITTLGRGGSDTTAVALASSLNCPCEIYTDVNSVKTVDPNSYKSAKSLHQISYDEMMEMAVNGAKVFEPRSVELAKKNNINLYLGKTLETDKSLGSIVNNCLDFEEMPIKNISTKDNHSIINIEIEKDQSINQILNLISNLNINYEMTSLTETEKRKIFSFSYPSILDEKVKLEVEKITKNFHILSNLVKLTIVGIGLSTHHNYLKQIVEILNTNNITIIQLSVSEISISILINLKDKEKAIELIAKEFDL